VDTVCHPYVMARDPFPVHIHDCATASHRVHAGWRGFSPIEDATEAYMANTPMKRFVEIVTIAEECFDWILVAGENRKGFNSSECISSCAWMKVEEICILN